MGVWHSAAALSFAVSNLHDELHSDDVRMRVRRWTTADFEPQQEAGVALGATLDAYNEMKRQVRDLVAECFHYTVTRLGASESTVFTLQLKFTLLVTSHQRAVVLASSKRGAG